MKDYYRILQVDPQAEHEVIEAAYRRLMRKYHPDVLSPDERGSDEVLRKVQELNEAYEVVGDAENRQAFDLSRDANRQYTSGLESQNQTAPSPIKTELEHRIYLVRCATTKRTFKMHLGRRKGWSGPFVVMGFELIDTQFEKPKVPNSNNLWGRLSANFPGRHGVAQPPAPDMLPGPDETLQNLLDLANTLSMGDIEWAGHKCPDCAGETINPNGTIGTWSRCGTCHRLKCAGNSKKRIDGYYSTCPWCGATNKTTRSVATGSREQAILRGKYSETVKQNLPQLTGQERKSLDNKKES
jgi:curved DNA-binding protein CbpA